MVKRESDESPNWISMGEVQEGTNSRLLRHVGLRETRITGEGIEQVFKIFEEEGRNCGDGSCADLQYFEFDRGFPKTIIAIHVRPDETLGPRWHIHGPELSELPLDEKNAAAVNLVFQRLREWGLEE